MGILSNLFNRVKDGSHTNEIEPLPFETDWKIYRVHAKYIKTDHFRTLQISAKSLKHCEALASEQGFLPPLEISELPPKLPTENQLEYAKKLNITMLPDMTFNELSDLITRKAEDGGDTPQVGLAEFAVSHNMHFSRYIGKNTLYDLIFSTLQGAEKIAFFIFSIYRWLSDDRDANLDTHVYKNTFYEFANTLISNEKFNKSMNRYRGSDIKFFGTLTVNDQQYIGGSTDTIAYKIISEYLKNDFDLKPRNTKTLSK